MPGDAQADCKLWALALVTNQLLPVQVGPTGRTVVAAATLGIPASAVTRFRFTQKVGEALPDSDIKYLASKRKLDSGMGSSSIFCPFTGTQDHLPHSDRFWGYLHAFIIGYEFKG